MIHDIQVKIGMAIIVAARVFMSGRNQAVRIRAEFRFSIDEDLIRRDPQNGDMILSPAPREWNLIYAALDSAHIPDDRLEDLRQDVPQT